MATEEELMREVTIPFARRTDGTGVALLYMRRGSAEYFGLDKLQVITANPELDGLVFNPCGPGVPVALAREAAQHILTAE